MEKQTISSIQKAITILELLGSEPYEYTAQVISKQTDINITTVYRILYQLEESDMVAMDRESKKYKIGPNMYHIGSTYLYNKNYKIMLEEILSEIADKTKESVGMAIKDGDKIISVIEIEVHQPMKMNDVPGKYFQPNKGNYGKCLMAFQDRDYIEHYLDTHTFEKSCPATLTQKEELLSEYEKIRKQGYSESIDEIGIDVIGVGIPLFNKAGQVHACVAIAFFREDGWENKLKNLRELLLSYQKTLEQYLPYS